MKFDVLTLFPEMFVPIQNSIIGRATKSKILEINLVNMRDFSEDKHGHVDDTPYRRWRWNVNKTRCRLQSL